MKKIIKNTLGFTLIEILIGIVISSIMMAAMFTSYTVVKNSYSKVTDVANISRAGRDIISMMMRDIRMAGFIYYYGLLRSVDPQTGETKLIGNGDIPQQDNLQFFLGDEGGEGAKDKSHAPIIIYKNTLGYDYVEDADEEFSAKRFTTVDKSNIAGDTFCCDRIHIVYGDFDINATEPYKRYRVSYYAKRLVRTTGDEYYGVFRSLESWDEASEDWSATCDECYSGDLIREHLVDMEFVAVDKDGLQIKTDPENKPEKLYDIRSVDVRLTFRSSSKQGYFKKNIERVVKAFEAIGTFNIADNFLRDSVFVTVHTRNIGGMF